MNSAFWNCGTICRSPDPSILVGKGISNLLRVSGIGTAKPHREDEEWEEGDGEWEYEEARELVEDRNGSELLTLGPPAVPFYRSFLGEGPY